MEGYQITAYLMLKKQRAVDIAEKFGVSRSAIHQVITGKTKSPRIRQHISDVLGIPVDQIWHDKAPSSGPNTGISGGTDISVPEDGHFSKENLEG